MDSLPITCLRPLLVRNPRFRYDIKSEEFARNRALFYEDYVENYFIEVPCGKCYLCRKKKANHWRVRLIEEIKYTPRIIHNGIEKYRCVFVCFTFDDEHLPRPGTRSQFSTLIRKWRDLWRKKYGKSPRYYAVTDRGSQFGRLHLHLLLFNPFNYFTNTPLSIEELQENNFFWRNGMVRVPTWVESTRAVSYVTSYITGGNLDGDALKHGKPICKEAKEYIPFVFCSNGIGALFVDNPNYSVDNKTGNFLYRYNGYYYGLPAYYRYKLIDYDLRWHTNLVNKYEKEKYFNTHNVLYYNVGNSVYSADQLKRLYSSSFAQFDSDNNKYIKLLYAK